MIRFSALLLLTVLGTAGAGCTHLDFGTYADTEEWFIDREHSWEPEYGFNKEEEHGSVGLWLINDLIRAPVFVLRDLGRILLVPVAAVHYTVNPPDSDGTATNDTAGEAAEDQEMPTPGEETPEDVQDPPPAPDAVGEGSAAAPTPTDPAGSDEPDANVPPKNGPPGDDD